MKQWEIYLFPFRDEKPHPAVIISNEERCFNEDLEYVNALLCTSARLNREARKNEVILNGADGLDWKIAVRCDVTVPDEYADFLADCLDASASWRNYSVRRGGAHQSRVPHACRYLAFLIADGL